MLVRHSVILLLTLCGFLILYVSTKDGMVLAYGCFALAGVYAWLTAPRRPHE